MGTLTRHECLTGILARKERSWGRLRLDGDSGRCRTISARELPARDDFARG
jgi:hypothetical protein